MTATRASVARLYVGTSGWSYPSWRPGFYPAGAKPGEFLGHYAERLPSVELNSTGYRIPAEDQFRRWAELTPAAFRFAVKMQAYRLRQAATFVERVQRSAIGSARSACSSRRRATTGFLTLALGSLDPELRSPATSATSHGKASSCRNAVRVNEREASAPFRYLRLREPPYTDEDLREVAATVRDPGVRLRPPRGRADRARARVWSALAPPTVSRRRCDRPRDR